MYTLLTVSVALLPEIALLFQERRVASVITKEVCYIYRLSKSDFDEVLSEYPKMRQVMINVARERLGETKKKLGLSLAYVFSW